MPVRIALILAFFCAGVHLYAQNVGKYTDKMEKFRSETWPETRSYARSTLGHALQDIFKQHTEYCGFSIKDSKRDFVPADIQQFLGSRTLRTRVETANIRGGGLLYYIFDEGETQLSFSNIQYMPSKIIRLASVLNQFTVNPDENFDAFILTKTCSGYLKAALDAGAEPPYSTFKTALATDNKRESSVLALSGSFLSPIQSILDARDAHTTELMMNLWQFYQQNPQFIGKAYYLREFQGVMIKHITSAEENRQIELNGGLNLNGPLPINLKTSFNTGAGVGQVFTGTDWETILFTDNEFGDSKARMFSPLPSPADIQTYFQYLRPVFQRSKDFSLLTEGGEHTHYLLVEGIPQTMTNQFWEIESINQGVYDGTPLMQSSWFKDEKEKAEGCRFTVTGRPLRSLFDIPGELKPSRLNLNYTIRSRHAVNGIYLRIPVQEEIQTSVHPIATMNRAEFDLSKREGRQFALQWSFSVDIEDRDNPVDYTSPPFIGNMRIRKNERELPVILAKVQPDPANRRYVLTLETNETYPLDRINDVDMQSYSISFDMHLKTKRFGVISVRPVKGLLAVPTIKEPVPVVIPEVVPVSGEGGN